MNNILIFITVVIISTLPYCSAVAVEELTIKDIDKREATDDATDEEVPNTSQEYTIKIQSVDVLNARGNDGCDGLPGPPGEKGDKGEPGLSGGGAVYTRWGRTVCPDTNGTELVYKGLAAGTSYSHSGGGANYLCTTEDPQYLSSAIPQFSANDLILTYLYGAEYQVKGFNNVLHNQNVPCAVCYTSQRSSKLMIPGRTTCPQSWTKEYIGYLMAEQDNHSNHKHPKVYECVDKNGETVPGEERNTNGALFHHVGAVCNVGLPCPPYVANRPITCVVCTK